MVKCPNCGSTAQVKQLDEKYTRLPTVIMTDILCKCGCGHKFWYYKREDYRGVREGTTFVCTVNRDE